MLSLVYTYMKKFPYEFKKSISDCLTMEKENKLCKYYIHNNCKNGKECCFAHDFKAKTENTCKFYLAGSCFYGNKCRYDHAKRLSVLKPARVTAAVSAPTTLTVLKAKKFVSPDSNMPVDAPVFIPGNKAHIGKVGDFSTDISKDLKIVCIYLTLQLFHLTFILKMIMEHLIKLCPFAAVRECPFGDKCEYMHGDLCEMCGFQCLHPKDENQRKEHVKFCVAKHECEMEIAFAAQRSQDVACCICLDIVKKKASPNESVFGLLENCNHPFCLSCIRKWRCSYNQQQSVVRSCPICRVTSWFVIPSEFWIQDEIEKKELIGNYKAYLSTISCRNFDQGRGCCQFGTSCFYKHALPDGTVDKSKPNIRYREDDQGQSTALTKVVLSQFFDAKESQS
ncbi:probable E3 ubiquitin-protein ligase makorin-1 isoform X2 [Hydra vulgaris]|uniref:probable E3 ubiquitin-protein ligase makorin-1 isoform X2 n=1 Tax=Hydra vulgaris TaxID=6087 RepID=UPI001F5F4A80|nr:probable E3 ubiquitin-protein ligase makorin-1 isoform X2 [Hydra vulgaris]